MNIIDNRTHKSIKFINIKKFGFFVYKDNLFIRTHEIKDNGTNVLNLTTERWGVFSPDDIVEPVNVDLVIHD